MQPALLQLLTIEENLDQYESEHKKQGTLSGALQQYITRKRNEIAQKKKSLKIPKRAL